MTSASAQKSALDWLQWYEAAGVDVALENTPQNRFQKTAVTEIESAQPRAAVRASGPMTPPSEATSQARALADNANTREELEQAVRNFDGCAIKRTASKTVFSDGNPNAKVMLIGEAPGAQEDMQGIPFCGPSGQLLDRMLAAIGMDRTHIYISNTVFWRPPGNRQPSKEEIEICRPLVERHIALINPKLLVLAGGTATAAILESAQGISRLRGKFYEYTNPYLKASIPVAVTYHPSYLLRSPGQKKLAWQDLLSVRAFIDNGFLMPNVA